LDAVRAQAPHRGGAGARHGSGHGGAERSLDVGDRLAKEFRGLGANLLVTPQADSLPLEMAERITGP